jgi:hypothetical protein
MGFPKCDVLKCQLQIDSVKFSFVWVKFRPRWVLLGEKCDPSSWTRSQKYVANAVMMVGLLLEEMAFHDCDVWKR